MINKVNYNETVVIPVLEKRFKDLVNANLNLEINLLVQQQINKDLEEEIKSLNEQLMGYDVKVNTQPPQENKMRADEQAAKTVNKKIKNES